MADPYATRAPGPGPGELPSGPPPWGGVVAERGGEALRLGAAPAGDPAFRYIHCRDAGILPPLARVSPEQAALLALVAAEPGAREATKASQLLLELRRVSAADSEAAEAGDSNQGGPVPLLAIKQGWVAGPEGSPGCTEVRAETIAPVLDALAAGTLEWEKDPDFGYDVPARVPGLPEPEARSLLPRLLYADHDRAYEHAALVAGRKRRLHAVAAGLSGLDQAVVAATGWPPRPTGSEWRDA